MTPDPPSTRAILGAFVAIAVLAAVTSAAAPVPAGHIASRRASTSLDVTHQSGAGHPVASGAVLRPAHRVRVTGTQAATEPASLTHEFLLARVLLLADDHAHSARLGVSDVATRGPPIPIL